MKPHLPTIGIIFILLLPGDLHAQEPDPRLILCRNTGTVKSATSCQIWIGDSLLCKVGNQAAWTSTFKPGTYEFRSLMSLDKEEGNFLTIDMKAGQLYLLEIDLARKGGQHAIPSAGYYFKLNNIHPRRIKSVLRRKAVSKAVQQALLQEMNTQYEIR